MEKPTRWIIDNFLPEDELKIMEEILYSPAFAWNTMDVVYRGDPDQRMVHNVFQEDVVSDHYNLFRPILRELKVEFILKAKINLDIKQKKTYKFHVDSPLFHEYNPAFLTGIFNFTDCNGGTLFKEDNKFIESKRNRMVIFSSCFEHAGVCPTNETFRYGLNINWLGEKPVRGEKI
tara:strand:- start:457 stop:984 length:528 start_codon:yes stop_codon:yes gene_type:complete